MKNNHTISCPVCGRKHFVIPSGSNRNIWINVSNEEENSDFYLKCPTCKKQIGFILRVFHKTV